MWWRDKDVEGSIVSKVQIFIRISALFNCSIIHNNNGLEEAVRQI